MALTASLAITVFALAWLMAWKPTQPTIVADSTALQVAWLPRAKPTPSIESTHRGTARPAAPKRKPSDAARVVKRTSEPISSVPAAPLNLRLPETAPVSFAPNPLRPRPASLTVDHLPRFQMREASLEGSSTARDCAELRAALAKAANAEVILRSMHARGCAL
ncbi:hypothetical protein AB4059_04375 [Lysobacter sp. 2RAF19]